MAVSHPFLFTILSWQYHLYCLTFQQLLKTKQQHNRLKNPAAIDFEGYLTTIT